MRMRTTASVWPVVTLLVLAACGSPAPAGAAPARQPSPTATPAAIPAVAVPSPTLPAVPDFAVVAYQGDQLFGGHEGHFSAVFAAGRPVVLLYFAGL